MTVQDAAVMCSVCSQRRENGTYTPTREEIAAWSCTALDSTTELCQCCSGVLQFGSAILDVVRTEIHKSGYEDVFGWPVSIQLSPELLFRFYIDKVLKTDGQVKPEAFVEVKDVLRTMIYNSVVVERFSEHLPKLFMEVAVQSPEARVPDELMKSVNQRIRYKPSGKKFRTRESVNIADFQQFVEVTKGDVQKVLKALVPSSPENDVTKMKLTLYERFVAPKISTFPITTVSMRRETVFLVGKYSKHCREFGQSQWDHNETSVSESICPVVCELFKSPIDKCLFSASGREDMDVRCLGSGRPFVLQVGDPRSLAPLLDDGKMLREVVIDTGDVVVKGLRWVDKGVMDWLHWSTEQHLKTYRCVVWSEEVLPENLTEVSHTVKNLKVFQKTPLRVLHRRTENTRQKTMHSVHAERLNDHYAIVTLVASAGAYIKEFIHADFGRTSPSFCDVIFGRFVRCDILQLDVLEVQQDDEEGYVPLWDRN
jgi:hypothetical protein